MYEKPSCQGRACTKCGKCRDWYYTGDQRTWQWITTVKKWNEAERKRWDDGEYENLFKHRNGYTCRAKYGYYYDRDHIYHGPHIQLYFTYHCGGCGPSDVPSCNACRAKPHYGVYSYCQCPENLKTI
ncbi:unnamed protein product [Rotaria sp. Silwood1]|nr:unnamed protein product [Rotaria sp. Silwood1]